MILRFYNNNNTYTLTFYTLTYHSVLQSSIAFPIPNTSEGNLRGTYLYSYFTLNDLTCISVFNGLNSSKLCGQHKVNILSDATFENYYFLPGLILHHSYIIGFSNINSHCFSNIISHNCNGDSVCPQCSLTSFWCYLYIALLPHVWLIR